MGDTTGKSLLDHFSAMEDPRQQAKVLYPLPEIRDLMQVTDRYCKFVFAGLHDVQRLARTPNSPCYISGHLCGWGL